MVGVGHMGPTLLIYNLNKGDYMKLYELTDKGRALLNKPRHKEPTNWEHCCSCCAVLEKENKELKAIIKGR